MGKPKPDPLVESMRRIRLAKKAHARAILSDHAARRYLIDGSFALCDCDLCNMADMVLSGAA